MQTKAQFIVVEGLEGAGKSSAIALVKNWLEQQGHDVVCTREPGGTPMAEQIRNLVKQVSDEQVSPTTELLLMYAARMQLITNVIAPALAAGKTVLADRHDLSSRAYQGGGRQLDEAFINDLRRAVLAGKQPDLTLYLDIDPKIGLQRALARGKLDRIEQEQLAFFQRTRAKYQQIAATEPNIITIDASQDIQQVHADIVAALNTRVKL
ncbi:dTMP kinase [Rheinheimera sp. MMS21-TC3]|uniref:dTMP kinase n=1 Tax=Rheinheimera sp. MMS21-TC3 TaxID=3072790 RepID=UPI0028C4D5F9|nr:dTMP kinase [Rheinheimera sp. MMS21-TC3]WNO61157.1 dTMP kinase [Rheinheimera sp. MMS21-TC3]